MPAFVRSHAKINLGLYIGAPRADGFHSLVTVYQTLEAHDIVTVSAHPASSTSIHLTSNDARVPTDGRNTAWKMVELALEDQGLCAEVEIHIDKRLPVQGGLGAGSANAVAALVGLERELGHLRENVLPDGRGRTSWLNIRQFSESMGAPEAGSTQYNTGNWPVRQLELAAKVGSDVPLFLVGGAVLGRNRGESVFPLADFEPVWCVVAIPSIGVSTPQAFRDWDALCAASGLTADGSEDKLEQLSRAYASAFAEAIPQGGLGTGSSGVPAQENQSGRGDLAGPEESALVRTGILSWIQNDFEKVVFPQHPSLCAIRQTLAAEGSPGAALHASLSGSGSALFGLYLAREHAEAASESLGAAGVQSILTRTLPRPQYWNRMLLHSED